MKKQIMSVMATCMLAAPLSFAQDTMKQQDNGKDQTQSSDTMKNRRVHDLIEAAA